MADVIFNAVLRIEGGELDGFHRVVATPPPDEDVWLAFIAPFRRLDDYGAAAVPRPARLTPVSRATLAALEAEGCLVSVDLDPVDAVARENALTENARAFWVRRCHAMAPFLDHQLLVNSLATTGGIGPLVKSAVGNGLARPVVYRLWGTLCINGFTTLGLLPRLDLCGAPGVLRPILDDRNKAGRKPGRARVGEAEPNPQCGVTASDRIQIVGHYRRLMRPGLKLASMYEQIIESVYVRRYVETPEGRQPVVPRQGTFPNRRQVRYIIESQLDHLERLRRGTTEGHFQRNFRGLVGRAYDGVPGPGHAYAIDSTIGDVYLRSAINRAWIIGRPIVYVVVDIWSTAIVGFYVCLDGPSWRTAKLALFSTIADQQLMADLWGYTFVPVLNPLPTAPFTFWCDRGEYNCKAAKETSKLLSINFDYDPPRRPDLKGLVEVVHRIAKDEQIQMFVPGAHDARRREIELKADPMESALTVRQYVKFLRGIFDAYNLCADRTHRLTAEMIGAGVQPSPAGLWRFGHEAGFGYRKSIPQDQLIKGLLHETPLAVRRNGNFVESIEYEGELAVQQEWAARARNRGTFERSAYMFPGSASRIWVPDVQGMSEFSVRLNGRVGPEITLEEWRDALAYDALKKPDRQHENLRIALLKLESNRAMFQQAVKDTARAEEQEHAKLSIKEARGLEATVTGAAAALAQPSSVGLLSTEAGADTSSSTEYGTLMDEMYARLNREEGV